MGTTTVPDVNSETTTAPFPTNATCTAVDAAALSANTSNLWSEVSSCYHDADSVFKFSGQRFDACFAETANLTDDCADCFNAMGQYYHSKCKKVCKDDEDGCFADCHVCMAPAFEENAACVGAPIILPSFDECSRPVTMPNPDVQLV